jgi:predicted ATPase
MLALDLSSALALALRGHEIAQSLADTTSVGRAGSMLGITYHHIGDQEQAQAYLEAVLMRSIEAQPMNVMVRNSYSTRNQDRCTLARILWLRGFANQAMEVAHQTLADAEEQGHPVILCALTTFLIPVYLWTGEVQSANAHIAKLMAHGEKHEILLYLALANGFRGEMLVLQGEPSTGVPLLRGYLQNLRHDENDPQAPGFCGALAAGQLALGAGADALRSVDRAMTLIEANGNLLYQPELLRIRAQILQSPSHANLAAAATILLRAIGIARQQSAKAWELRAATSLAMLYRSQGRISEARETLLPLYDSFTEGLETADLKAAKQLIDGLG